MAARDADDADLTQPLMGSRLASSFSKEKSKKRKKPIRLIDKAHLNIRHVRIHRQRDSAMWHFMSGLTCDQHRPPRAAAKGRCPKTPRCP